MRQNRSYPRSLSELRGPRVRETPNDPSVSDATDIRKTFMSAKPEFGTYDIGQGWPSRLYHVGESCAIAYTSHKWKKDRTFEDYKHVREARNELYATDAALRARPDLRRSLSGEVIPSEPLGADMPRVVAEVAPLIMIEAQRYERPGRLPEGDRGYVRLALPGSVLYAGYARPLDGGRKRKFFLAAIDPHDGVYFIVVGPKLGITVDGIVG